MAECIHELPQEQCAYCSVPKELPIFWDAQFVTTCPSCQSPINVGDRVKWSRDGINAEHARHGRP